ncbi:MAG: helix-turn-helix domain-containing protein [Desulfobacterales bacterium]|nr:helix-turn-helix domain-containing protein [Desulfobacterales bacterium]
MNSEIDKVSSGINPLDQMLHELFIGDNVIWYDEAKVLVPVFIQKFIQESLNQHHPLIYVSFDRSPKNLLDQLGTLAENQCLTILDCFTNGKGDGSEIYNKIYEKFGAQFPYQIIKVTEPWKPDVVAEAIYGLHKDMSAKVVRLIFESITGMQDLWGSEDHVLRFYSHACPKLYELETIAYWIMEKEAHSERLKANINQIAQVIIDLSMQRGKSTLTIMKAEKRPADILNKPCYFLVDGLSITFAEEETTGQIALGKRIKQLRIKQGMSQTDLAKSIGVTPSTISQVENNLIYPSIPALYKIAERLTVNVCSLFNAMDGSNKKFVFKQQDRLDVQFANIPKNNIKGESLLPVDIQPSVEPYLIEIPPYKKLQNHFFMYKGDELGYVIKGTIQFTIQNETYDVSAGQLIYFDSDFPTQWKNPTAETAQLLWIKVK